MAFRDGPLQDLKVPLAWIGALSAVVAGCLALGLLLTDSRSTADGGAYGSARGEFSEVMQPVSGVLAAPLRGLGSVGAYVSGYFFAVSENRRLKERLKALERVREDAIAIQNVNRRYEELLKLRTEPPVPMVTARVVADSRGPFTNQRLADSGSDRGVRVGYPVMSDHGVVGRIVGVAAHASRILLLTDPDSRTPVLVDRTGARSILTGDGGAAPRLEYLRGVDPIKAGDVILSSGDGGMFPRGLPVGVAVKDVRGAWRVRLYSEAQDIDYVRIVQFEDFSKLVAEAELRTRTLPPLPAADSAQLALATAARAAPPPAASTPTSTTSTIAPALPRPTATTSTTPAPLVRPTPTLVRPRSAPAAAASDDAPATSTARPATTTTVSRPRGRPAATTTSDSSTPRPPRVATGAARSTTGARSATTTTTAARTTTATATKPKPSTPRRPKPPAARDRMAPVPDDYRPAPRRTGSVVTPGVEAATRRDGAR